MILIQKMGDTVRPVTGYNSRQKTVALMKALISGFSSFCITVFLNGKIQRGE
jgi:hypothetical protein